MDGRYKILRLLGKGSEGSVYLAFQEKLFRFYAVKEVDKEGICFSQESIEVWKTLQSTGLPEIVDILENEKQVWIIMEYVEGCNLQDYLKETKEISVRRAADWCLQIIDVLEYLHRQKPPILYGDLKPDNLILRKNRIVMVDMGSLIRQGSQGKRTGTREYMLPGRAEEMAGDLYSLGKLMEILALYCQSRQIGKIAEKIRTQAQNGQTRISKNVKRKLIFLKWKKYIETGMLCIAVPILLFAGYAAGMQRKTEIRVLEYDTCISELYTKSGKEKEEKLLALITDYPQRKEAYLELLREFQEDLEMDQEEERMFRKLWKEILPGREETTEELLKKNPADYQRVAYESGITYWFFYKGLQGRRYASAWFQKITAMPQEICTDPELWEKSILYGKLGEYREKWKHYDETGEKEKIFSSYWKDICQLLGKKEEQISMARMMLWKETLAAWKHYMVELQEEGVKQEEIRGLLKQMEKEIAKIPEGHQRMAELKEHLEEDKQQIDQMLARIFQ